MNNTDRIWIATCLFTVSTLMAGCATAGKKVESWQRGESAVFVGEEPVRLAFVPATGQPIRVRSTYVAGVDSVEYAEGRDFVVDNSGGALIRTSASRLPDFRENLLYGQEAFDHSKFPGFGNLKYFAFVDYVTVKPPQWPVQTDQRDRLRRVGERLRNGQTVRMVAFGDSITAGGDATKPEFIFWARWADALRQRYPLASVEAINGATGGDTTVQGLIRLQEKVLDARPDLVLIGFGMNDHNINSVTIPKFEKNLETMIARIREATTAEIVLFSAFPPNPKWKFGSHHMEDYAAATERVAKAANCAFADVFNNWQTVAARKKPEDLLGNNINHPNDFGHWIYFRVLEAMGL